MTNPILTKAQRKAFKALQDNGGEGVFDRYGRVIARGEVLKTFSGSTWARLMTMGVIVPAGKNRIKIAESAS